jgi:ribulose-5-phosphate 4-epimerase/fuculose-1-phosphate aldolase
MFGTAVSAEVNATIDDLVAANRILSHHGVLDGFGHVSARLNSDPTRFLLSRSKAPALVTAGDILAFDLEGMPVAPVSHGLYLERFIHSEIYRRHPDISAVVHSHSPSVIPFGVTSIPLKPVFHLGAFLGAGAPVFDIRTVAGDGTDLLIRTPALGAALAATLGASAVTLLRGHGNVVVATNVREVVFRAIYAEVNARLQADAIRIGGNTIEFLTLAEAVCADTTNRLVVDRAWTLWRQRAAPRSRQPRPTAVSPR